MNVHGTEPAGAKMQLPLLSSNYPDRLGCYRVGDLKFYSKLEAIEMHAKTGIHPHWDFNEAVFSSYDWTVEPADNILELYHKRAQQLRDKYDYIVLMYSGGSDSHNILQAFIDNDILLDEVASHVNYSANANKDDFLNSEAFRVSIPTIERLKADYPWLHHRIIDMTELTIDYYNQNNNKFDWIYDLNMFFNPNSACRKDLPFKIKEWADMIHAGKRVCMLWGHDKPRIMHIDGKWSMRFIDLIDSGPTVKSIAGQQPYTDELFYWTPDMPEIIIKQSHLVKNYLMSNNPESLPFVSEKKSDLAYREINSKRHWLNNHGMHSLIYPKWDINTFSAGKSPSLIFSPRDTWFFNLSDTLTAHANWQVGIDKLWQVLPDYWKNDPTDMFKGVKACWSKDYYLQ